MFKNIAVLPPTESVGSLGDQILLKGLVDSNPNQCNYTLLLNNTTPDSWKFLFDYPYKFEILQLTKNVYDGIFAIGADCIDGKYSTIFLEKILYLNRKYPDLPIRVISCSYNKNPSARSVQLVKELSNKVVFYLRDSISKERFDQQFNSVSMLMSDLGFALKNSNHTTDIPKDRILINLNDMNKEGYKYLTKFNELFKDHPVLLLQHDYRSGHNEKELLIELSRNIKNSLFVLGNDVNKLKNVYKDIKYSVSARLHICIMTLSAGKGTIGLNYQDKMEGVFKDFEIGELVCKSNENIIAMHNYLIENQQSIEERIIRNLPMIKERIGIIWT